MINAKLKVVLCQKSQSGIKLKGPGSSFEHNIIQQSHTTDNTLLDDDA